MDTSLTKNGPSRKIKDFHAHGAHEKIQIQLHLTAPTTQLLVRRLLGEV
jgi:hypothetical protein